MKKQILLMMSVVGMLCGCSHESALERQVNRLYEQMSQEERLAQLNSMYVAQLFDDNGLLDTARCKQLIPNGIGHFSQYASQMSEDPNVIRDQVAQVQTWLIENTPSGIPALFHEELLTGVCTRGATVYPQQIGLACSFNPELAQKKTEQTGVNLRKIGGMLGLSPMVDVVRTPSFNRLEESYGEDAYLSAVMGTAFVKGLQQGDLRKGVAACSKHFLGYGGGGDANEKELMEEILLPHETMIRLAGSQVVMTGYHAVHGVQAVASEELQEQILRNYLHFDGLLVSDYGSIDQIPDMDDNAHRAAAAINAGNDVDFPKGTCYSQLPQAMALGLVTEATIERAVKNVLRLKAQLGMLDKNAPLYATEHIVFDTPEERQTAYELATQSVVLLQNNDHILPLQNAQKVLLTGPNANSMWAMLGDYTFQGMRYFWQRKIEDDMHPQIINLKQGMENRLPAGFTLAYSRGCDWTEEVETIIEEGGDERAEYMRSVLNRKMESGEEANAEEALQLAQEADVIIAAVGENAILCGENRDRTTLRLPGKQEEYVNRLIATGKPVILIVFGGRAQVISGLAERCAAVIQAWYPGEEGGNALADILFGNISPSGKLSVSYPNQEIHQPLCYSYSSLPDSRVAWPFGYGMSYTEFEYSDMQLDPSTQTNAEHIHLAFSVKNIGEMAADEIAQVYIATTSGEQHIRPISLQGFQRIHLLPGEQKEIQMLLSPEQFGYYADGHWNIDPGRYIVKIGASSTDIRLSAEVELTGHKLTPALRTTYFAHIAE